jgi:hypothetical protein
LEVDGTEHQNQMAQSVANLTVKVNNQKASRDFNNALDMTHEYIGYVNIHQAKWALLIEIPHLFQMSATVNKSETTRTIYIPP